MAGSALTRAFASLRVAIGAGSFLAPRLSGRAFGLDPDRNPQLPVMARLFGVRDLALGVGVLTTEGDARRRWLQLGLVCDAADAATGAIARRNGEIGAFAGVVLTGAALVGVGLGVHALQVPHPAGPPPTA
jgi:Domain of unknown function (DUF4267)